MRLKYDWIDALLMCAGFVLYIVLSTTLKQSGYGETVWFGLIFAEPSIMIFFLFGPAVRRIVWGEPRLPPLKKGSFWSFVSAGALFLMLLGMGALAFSSFLFKDTMGKQPDFMEQSRAFHAKLTDFSKLIPRVKYKHETMAQFRQRLAKEDLKRKEDRKKSILKYAKEKEEDWKKNKTRLRDKSLNVLGFGLLLILVGVGGIRWRYASPHK
jgi:hypothetical protein